MRRRKDERKDAKCAATRNATAHRVLTQLDAANASRCRPMQATYLEEAQT